jgi:PPIC-type PPIASE domain
VVARPFHPPTPIGHDPNGHALADAGADEARAPMFALADAGATGDDAGPLLLSDLVAAETDRRQDAGIGVAMPDGTPVPALSFTAPREVRFGVVLVSYTGAQPSAGGGKPAARSRADAKALAAKLLATAQQDFHSAVQQGDAGSADDVGRVKRGVLEPAPEYVLFNLDVNAVSGPVDTPRGYWIVKRLE